MSNAMRQSVFMVTALLASTACGVEPGDYLVYRVGLSAVRASDDCYYPDEMPPIDVVDDSDSRHQGQTWVVYFASGDHIMLDAAGVSLRGEDSDDGFLFTSHSIDVSYVGMEQQEAKITEDTVREVDMIVDGSAIAGELRQIRKIDCTFLTATPSAGVCEAIPDCVQTRSFSGVELDDVELTSDVN